jgi:hypothetical protein
LLGVEIGDRGEPFFLRETRVKDCLQLALDVGTLWPGDHVARALGQRKPGASLVRWR